MCTNVVCLGLTPGVANAGYAVSEEPYDLAQQTGAFEIVAGDSAHGQVARQMVLQTTVAWCQADAANKSVNMIGDFSW